MIILFLCEASLRKVIKSIYRGECSRHKPLFSTAIVVQNLLSCPGYTVCIRDLFPNSPRLHISHRGFKHSSQVPSWSDYSSQGSGGDVQYSRLGTTINVLNCQICLYGAGAWAKVLLVTDIFFSFSVSDSYF